MGEDGSNSPPQTEPEAPRLPGFDSRPNAAQFSLPADLDLVPPGWTVAVAFPNVSFNVPVALVQAPGTRWMFVAERDGRIFAFRNEPAVDEKHLLLDISDRTQGGGDSGLLGLVFHPEFGQPDSPNRAFVYVHYAFNPEPLPTQELTNATPTVSRLARFTVDLDSMVIDPASELVLIDQADGSVWHQGGAMLFHPDDGFLYLAVGDEGMSSCNLGNCQRIDRDLFSGVLRIDVDMRGGDISHPIPRQPASGVTANYFIPNDNPFVGESGVLEEFYALGLRSPHRMTYDPVDDITWIGDVGESRREELNILSAAANYQWNSLEGTLVGPAPAPLQPIGIWTPPAVEIDRAEAAAIIGGYVYRGARLPELVGKYVFADFTTGRLWALTYSYDGSQATVLDRELLMNMPFRGHPNGITSFGVDEDGELYILTMGQQAKIHRLERTEGRSNAPLRLSETGVFETTAGAQLVPQSGLIPYDVQSPLWSDGATKQRWASIPDGEVVGFSEGSSWTFPVGSVFVKQFDMVMDESRPDEHRRLETRVWVRGQSGQYYGLSYRWNEAGSDAILVQESRFDQFAVTRADGSAQQIAYLYPGPADCAVCHNAEAGFVLGVRTSQLNHDYTYAMPGRTANQLFTWSHAELLDTVIGPTDVEALPRLASPTDPEVPLTERVKSYWAGNCSMCHGVVPGLRANWDARYEVALDDQGLIMTPSVSLPESFLVVPGDAEGSVLYQRSSSSIPGYAMPPLGRSIPDRNYVLLLEEWLKELDQ